METQNLDERSQNPFETFKNSVKVTSEQLTFLRNDNWGKKTHHDEPRSTCSHRLITLYKDEQPYKIQTNFSPIHVVKNSI